MTDHPYAHGSFEESVCLAADDDGILTERQLARLLAAHCVTMTEYLTYILAADPYGPNAYAAVTVLSWLGY